MKSLLATVLILALYSLPYLLDVYFNPPHKSDQADDEYIPDGR